MKRIKKIKVTTFFLILLFLAYQSFDVEVLELLVFRGFLHNVHWNINCAKS